MAIFDDQQIQLVIWYDNNGHFNFFIYQPLFNVNVGYQKLPQSKPWQLEDKFQSFGFKLSFFCLAFKS